MHHNIQRADIWYFDTKKDFRLKLHPQEIKKGLSFYTPKHQHRYLTTRAIIKDILHQYLSLKPSHTWVFSENKYGKPFLAEHPNVHFNWSHSGDDGLFIISWDEPVGIDIEHQRKVEYLAIAKILYSKEEQAFLAHLSPDDLPYHFFHIWSQKEAFIKASGLGLSYPTQRVTRPILPPTHQGFVDPEYESNWTLISFMPKPLCCAALCHHPSVQDIRYTTRALE